MSSWSVRALFHIPGTWLSYFNVLLILRYQSFDL